MHYVVTGAASGIGAAVLRRLTDNGDAVTPWDLQSVSDVRPVDVTSSASIAAAIDGLPPEIDGAVLAAGVSRMSRLEDTSDDDWNFQMNVNAFGVFACLRALIPRVRPGGAFVVVDSVGGLSGAPFLSAYCASKFAVTGLIESVTPELAQRGIRINAVCPMYVRTPMESRELEWEAALTGQSPEDVFAGYVRGTPLGRVAEPEEIAASVWHLLSDESRYTTGSMLVVSGGAHLGPAL
ncbi:SDR family NAD(P)-dependent oxidoreductase [Agromyces sp. Soil535]|uniref:SDR family NAD(P)-dependent oxidoreductase n=1 Tax=Agromyces sp. Soil535 TaxID=1736390 RepID=UPI0009EC8C39|nr:SDR family oxidoreductase [Agromyces sp. Soil535]